MPDIDTRIESPQLQSVADRIAGVLKAAATKATANLADPSRFPLSQQPEALERLMRAHLATVSAAGRDTARASVLAKVADPAWRGREFGEIAALRLESVTAVEEQAAVTRLPAIGMAEALARALDETRAPAPMAPLPSRSRELALRIHRVVCHDDTSELFRDEIFLGGTTVDETGGTRAVTPFKVRSFRQGDAQVYLPPKRFTSFTVREGGARFPKAYQVALVLVERDMGDLAGFLDQVTDRVRDQVHRELSRSGASRAPAGIVVAKVLGSVLDEVFGFLQRLWGDEIFAPHVVRLDLPTPAHRPATAERALVYAGHGGKYELVYDWHVPV